MHIVLVLAVSPCTLQNESCNVLQLFMQRSEKGSVLVNGLLQNSVDHVHDGQLLECRRQNLEKVT